MLEFEYDRLIESQKEIIQSQSEEIEDLKKQVFALEDEIDTKNREILRLHKLFQENRYSESHPQNMKDCG